MIGWLITVLQGLISDQSGFIALPRFAPYRDKDGEGGEGDGDGSGDEFDNFGGEGDGDGDGDGDGSGGDGGGDLEGLDETKVLKFLESKGVKVKDMAHLSELQKNLSGITTKHQSATDAHKALRAVLGEDEYNSLLSKGMRKISGGEGAGDDDFGIDEPAHFKEMNPETKSQITDTYNYFFQKHIREAVPAIIQGVMKAMDEKSFREDNPDYDENREAYDNFMKEHGITSRSPKTLAMVKKLLGQEAEGGLKELSENEDGSGGRRKPKHPAPKGGDRGEKDMEIDWDNEEQVRAYYEKKKKASAAQSGR
ncbi:MAG: hypothetical protein ACYSR5_05155 [Planctomycetota bacterium]|jgi:hypothetical protein